MKVNKNAVYGFLAVAFVLYLGGGALAGEFYGQDVQTLTEAEQTIFNAVFGGQTITGLEPTYVQQSAPAPVCQTPCAAPAPQVAKPAAAPISPAPAPPVQTADFPLIAKGLAILALELPIKGPKEINGQMWYPDKPPWFVMYQDKNGNRVDRQGNPSKVTEVWDHRPEGSKLVKIDGPIFPKG